MCHTFNENYIISGPPTSIMTCGCILMIYCLWIIPELCECVDQPSVVCVCNGAWRYTWLAYDIIVLTVVFHCLLSQSMVVFIAQSFVHVSRKCR